MKKDSKGVRKKSILFGKPKSSWNLGDQEEKRREHPLPTQGTLYASASKNLVLHAFLTSNNENEPSFCRYSSSALRCCCGPSCFLSSISTWFLSRHSFISFPSLGFL